VFPTNTTNGTGGRLAPFNGMVAAGIHDVQPNNEEGVITLWEWKSGIRNNSGIAPPIMQGESSPMNTTTTTSELTPLTNVP
jgi:hypothetical protein